MCASYCIHVGFDGTKPSIVKQWLSTSGPSKQNQSCSVQLGMYLGLLITLLPLKSFVSPRIAIAKGPPGPYPGQKTMEEMRWKQVRDVWVVVVNTLGVPTEQRLDEFRICFSK